MADPVVVVGAGGFGRETLDVIEAHNAAAPESALAIAGVADDSPSAANLERLAQRGVAHLGTIEDVLGAAPGSYVIGVGAPRARAAIAARFDAAGWRAVAVVHPSAVLGSRTTLGPGSVVCAGVQVSTNISFGRHVHLNPNATIGHDTVVGDFTSVNPGAIVSGDVRVGEQVLIGAGAVVLQGLTVGEGALVGASACVTRDVTAGRKLAGVPARELGDAV